MKKTSARRARTAAVRKSPEPGPDSLISKDVEGGPLSRELVTIQITRLADFIARSGRITFARHTGFSDFEWRVFIWVCETPPVSINELSALVHRGPAQVSRTVQRLVAAGLLNRANVKGGPMVAITPTPLGYTIYEPLVSLARERNSTIVAGLSDNELRVLDKCVAMMMKNALALLREEQKGPAENQGKIRRGSR